MTGQHYVGAVELGGTKTMVSTGLADGTLFERAIIPTGAPDMVIRQIAAFFGARQQRPVALGVGAFGPVVVDRGAPDFGRILETNKPGWSGFDLNAALSASIGLPLELVTDAGAAAIAEGALGALHGQATGVYLTIGTGIGGAILADGRLLPSQLHPEMGHVLLTRQPGDDAPSACSYHENCAEGLAAGPAIIQRFGKSLNHFDPHGPEYRLIAGYLGQLLAMVVLMISPMKIVMGGGVGQAIGLIPKIRQAMIAHLGPYGEHAAARDDFIQPPALGQNADIAGALICAVIAAQRTAQIGQHQSFVR